MPSSKKNAKAAAAAAAAADNKPKPAQEAKVEQDKDAKNGQEQQTKPEKNVSKIVDDLLNSPNLSDLSPEEKLKAVALMLHETTEENLKLRDEVRNLIEQLTKQDQTKEALQKLTSALKTQIELTREEGDLKLREETQRRIECSKQFQDTISELSTLIETHSTHNNRLKDENVQMSTKLNELLRQFEEREKKLAQINTEHDLQMKLYEAQLAKSKIEKAEINADFTKERLTMHKELLEVTQTNEELLRSHNTLQDQIEVYREQYRAIEKDMGSSSQSFNHFRKEMERLGKQMREVERDTQEWKIKYETSNEQVRKMNAAGLEREKELTSVKRKLEAMEKLNRALQKERADLLQKTKKSVEEKK